MNRRTPRELTYRAPTGALALDIIKAARTVSLCLDELLDATGLRHPQFAALQAIQVLHPVSGADLSRVLGITQPGVAQTLSQLEDRDLIVRHHGGAAGLLAEPTEHGTTTLQAAAAAVRVVDEEITALVGDNADTVAAFLTALAATRQPTRKQRRSRR